MSRARSSSRFWDDLPLGFPISPFLDPGEVQEREFFHISFGLCRPAIGNPDEYAAAKHPPEFWMGNLVTGSIGKIKVDWFEWPSFQQLFDPFGGNHMRNNLRADARCRNSENRIR